MSAIQFVDFPAACPTVGDGTAESPARIMFIGAYAITRDPILNEQFRPFVEAGGYDDLAYWTTEGWALRTERAITKPSYFDDPIWGGASVPVTGVSWYEADAFCRWMGGRLPSEWEWELACAGVSGRAYPWGSQDPDETMANFAPTGDPGVRLPTAPEHFALNVSPEGVRDLSGNFAEWCAEQYEPMGVSSTRQRVQYVTRGGCALDTGESLRCSARGASSPSVRDNLIGFRVARNVENR